MGNLFARGATPTEIEGMTFHQLMYWDKWCQIMNKQDEDDRKALRGGK